MMYFPMSNPFLPLHVELSFERIIQSLVVGVWFCDDVYDVHLLSLVVELAVVSKIMPLLLCRAMLGLQSKPRLLQ